MSTTVIRLLVILGATVGSFTGAIIAISKLVPERAKIIVGYQDGVIENLVQENERQAKRIDKLERRVRELETPA